MTGLRTVVVLDSLFDDLDVESSTAAVDGWAVERWDGDPTSLVDTVAVVHVRTRVDRALIDGMPALRVIGRFGTGLDSVDQRAAAERAIRVVGVRDYCVPELTTHTLGLAFALDRRIDAVLDGRLRPDATWEDVSATLPITGRTTATVVGLGTIGRAVTTALLACGLSVRVVTRHGADEARSLGAVPVDLEEGLTGAGFIFLHTSLTDETNKSIDEAKLSRMSPGTILVDTARIGLLDEPAVAAALGSGRLGGLAIDAKLPPGSPLSRFQDDVRLLVTPHIGWYSERSARDLRERTIRDTIAGAQALDQR